METCKDCGEEITEDQSNACDHRCGACFRAYEKEKRFSSNVLLVSGIILILNGILLVVLTFLPQLSGLIAIRVLTGISAVVCIIVSTFLLFLRIEEQDKKLAQL